MNLSSVVGEPEQRFKDCTPLDMHCPHCHEKITFRGAIVIHEAEGKGEAERENEGQERKEEQGMDVEQPTPSAASSRPFAVDGFTCPTPGCVGLSTETDEASQSLVTSLSTAVLLSYRSALTRYYTASWQCNDASCRLVTRDVSSHPRVRCLKAKCQGRPVLLQSANGLYLHLLYLVHLFDVDAQLERVNKEEKRRQEVREAAMAAAATAPSPSSQSSQWLPPPTPLTPSSLLSKRQVEVMRLIHTRVAALLQQSAYHFIPPTVFATRAGKRAQ